MNERLIEAFDVCLAALESGKDLESCLELYPALAADLRPALEGTLAARSIQDPYVPNAALQRSRARLLQQAAQLRAQESAPKSLFGRLSQARAPRLAFASLILVLVFLLSWQGLVVSAKALPGDPLYPVKRAAESVQLQLATSQKERDSMEVDYNQRRVDEIRNLFQKGRVEGTTLQGVVTEMNPESWVVEGIPVELTAQTRLSGQIETGRVVVVEGKTLASGVLEAQEIHLRYYNVSGVVEATSRASWTISGSAFKLRSDSQIDPSVRIGDQVVLLVYVDDAGTLYASAVLRFPVQILQATPAFTPFEIEFSGKLEAVNGVIFTIGGKTVTTNPQTLIKDPISIGELLKVKALVTDGGVLVAQVIELDTSGSGSSAGSGETGDDHPGSQDGGSQDGYSESTQVEPGDGSQESPTETVEPEDTKEPTETVEPKETEEPPDAPQPTEIVEPTETAEPTETEEPADPVEPTETVKPSESVEPTETEDPAEGPTPTIEPTETEEPEGFFNNYPKL